MKQHTRRSQIALFVAVLFGVVLPLRSYSQKPMPADVVQKLYREVVARHPMGVPRGAAKAAMWPLLSERLVQVFETRNSCDQDWDRRHRNADPPEKAPGFYEVGLFSGSTEQGYVNGATVGSAKQQADGSYLVNVKLWSYFDDGDISLRTGKIYRWRVADRVIFENERFVVDDVLGFKGVFDSDKSVFMSKMLATGCKGTRSTFN